jgi:hypothetical protein
VEKLSVTSHQRLGKVCAFFSFGGAFEAAISTKSKYNKGSDVPFMVRLRSIYGPFTLDDMLRLRSIYGPFMLRLRSIYGPFMLRLRSIYGPLTVGDMGRVIAHHRCADGNGILRPQPMKHLDGFSDDFPGDFGVIFGVILAARIIALNQGRASIKWSSA